VTVSATVDTGVWLCKYLELRRRAAPTWRERRHLDEFTPFLRSLPEQ